MSMDGGGTWLYTLRPITLPPRCRRASNPDIGRNRILGSSEARFVDEPHRSKCPPSQDAMSMDGGGTWFYTLGPITLPPRIWRILHFIVFKVPRPVDQASNVERVAAERFFLLHHVD